jgi:omega-6 fatty acid desaturase (delta-12 desaturase)
LGHDQHHRFTNHTGMDNAWRPFFPVEFATAPHLLRVAYRAMRSYFWWLASIAHWAVVHFYSPSFMARLNDRDRRQYMLSATIVVIFAAIALPTLVYTVGWWGLVKYWLMPWLVYHFWMSTFTLVHHTHPEIPFRDAAEWDAVEAQLRGTVHCDYPFWVEWLCHDISVHIPHHISTAIPAYHLRQADRALQDRFGDQMVRERFGWSLMRQIVQECHLFDRRKPYLSFQELAERQGGDFPIS